MPGLRFDDIRRLVSVDSTNRYLMGLAARGAPEGVVVVADHQSAGRGRRGRTWEAEAGAALLLSVLFRPDPEVLAVERRWLLTAAFALAGADACGPGVAIKWPNDLLVGGAKLAGILAEADAVAGAIVVGIGINVTSGPPGAACLGPDVDREDVLDRFLRCLADWYGRWDDVGSAFRDRCATVGQTVRVEVLGEVVVVGRAEAVEEDGALRVVTGARGWDDPDRLAGSEQKSTHRFYAAEVIHVTRS